MYSAQCIAQGQVRQGTLDHSVLEGKLGQVLIGEPQQARFTRAHILLTRRDHSQSSSFGSSAALVHATKPRAMQLRCGNS